MVTMKSKSTETAMIIQTGQKWYDIYPIEISTVGRRLPRDKEISLRKEAETLLNQECQLYLKSLQSGSKKAEFSWMLSVTKTGTFADKLSAHTLLLQDSAIHNLESLRTLTGMVQANAKREYLMSLAQLKEVYLADLLPPRKLRNFCDLVFELPEDEEERNVKLMVSYFEDQLKHYYKQFIDAIVKMSHDAIPLTKSKSISAFYELLKSNPEQEQYLLENLVNKLGDPVAKSASLALYLLKKLMVEDHPAMKEVIVKEVERVMFRPNVKERAQFYCLCFLQEVVFTLGDTDLANRLIDIYFGFFKKCTNEGDVNNKTMKGILSGVSRALPFSSLGQNVVRQHMEVFFRMIHLVNISIAIQILCLLFQVVSLETHHLKKKSLKSSRKKIGKKGKDSDLSITSTMTQTISPAKDDEMKEAKNLQERYYSALYRFLLRKDVFESTSRLAMLFNLLYRSMKYDEVDARVLAFVKRLLQISSHANSQFCASVMILLSKISRTHANVETYLSSNSATGNNENGEYTLICRNPIFSNADKTSPWEMTFLRKHYHPSIAIFARSLQVGQEIEYDGDPLEDFSLRHFLDKFVHKASVKKDDKKEQPPKKKRRVDQSKKE